MTHAKTVRVRTAIPALRNFARRFCRQDGNVDDLVHESYKSALINLDGFHEGIRHKSLLLVRATGTQSPSLDADFVRLFWDWVCVRLATLTDESFSRQAAGHFRRVIIHRKDPALFHVTITFKPTGCERVAVGEHEGPVAIHWYRPVEMPSRFGISP